MDRESKGKSAGKSRGDESLGAADWIRAALDALAEDGFSAVSVEPLARRLGVTKGSFYWHFADRGALVDAVLRTWEDESTEAVVRELSAVREPRARIAKAIALVSSPDVAWKVHVALGAEIGDPRVAETLARVSARRIAYLADAFRELGLPPKEATSRATLAYAAHVGLVHLRAYAPGVVPEGAALGAYVRQFTEAVVPVAPDDPTIRRAPIGNGRVRRPGGR
ncbi:MAG: TetR/AcrR family transcriptional regulator [Polyangiaceae bacterium]